MRWNWECYLCESVIRREWWNTTLCVCVCVCYCSKTCVHSSSPVPARTPHLPTTCTGEYSSVCFSFPDWKQKQLSLLLRRMCIVCTSFSKTSVLCFPPQVCDCGVWGSGHSAERSKDPWDVPERHEEIQSGFTQGQQSAMSVLQGHFIAKWNAIFIIIIVTFICLASISDIHTPFPLYRGIRVWGWCGRSWPPSRHL